MIKNSLWVSCVVGLSILSGCHQAEKKDSRLASFPVREEKVARRDLEETLTLVGTIKARDEATLFSRVPGKLMKNLVREGDRIAKNASVALVERDEVGVKYEPAPVPSTLTGVVARVYLDRGANVTLETPIALVVDQGEVLVRAEVPERYAGKVSVKQDIRVKVDAYPDRVFQGKVSRVSPVVDATTRSTYMEASLDNAGGLLRSGMFAKVVIVIGKRDNALSIPLEALTEGSKTVFVDQEGKARPRELGIGLRGEKFVEVQSGLSEGETVITFGLFGLKDGSALEILK
jgi:multidrug efflux pump subunit AcrA (membrane-fusion protein)